MNVVDKYPDADWEKIEEIWATGIGSLGQAADESEVPLTAILLAAKEKEWKDRGSPWINVKPKEIKSADSVNKSHKQNLSMIRELTELLLKQIEFEDGIKARISALDKLSAISTRNIAMERQVYSLDAESDGAPDFIIINS